jgi:hypothetical protein
VLRGDVHLNKVLGEEPRRLVPLGIDIEGTVLDPRMKPHGGVIQLPCPVVTYMGREELFGRAERPGYSYESAHPKYWTKRVLVPWVENFMVVAGRPVLSMPLFRADNVIRVTHRFAKGEATAADVQTSVNRYHDEIERALTGKDGLLTRDMFGVRCANSLRAVMVPDPELEYYQFGLPESAAARAGIKNGDWIIALRSPVLWQGSVLVAQAKICKDTFAAYANPFVMQGLGLDFDGDQMAFIKIDTARHPQLLHELRSSVGDPTIETFQWSDEFLINDVTEEMNWDHADLEITTRLMPTGMSLGPEDVLEPHKSEFLAAANKAKETPEDFARYAEGLDIRSWAKEAEAAAVEVCRLKLEVGLLGATTDKLNQVLLAFNPGLLRVGLELKEKLTDKMMKNAKQHGGLPYDTNRITALFDRRGEFEDASVEKALEYVQEVGLDPGVYQPVVELVYDLGGVTNAVKAHMPLQQTCRARDRAALVQVLKGNMGLGSIAKKIFEYTEEAHGSTSIISGERIQAAGTPRRDTGRLLRDELRRL